MVALLSTSLAWLLAMPNCTLAMQSYLQFPNTLSCVLPLCSALCFLASRAVAYMTTSSCNLKSVCAQEKLYVAIKSARTMHQKTVIDPGTMSVVFTILSAQHGGILISKYESNTLCKSQLHSLLCQWENQLNLNSDIYSYLYFYLCLCLYKHKKIYVAFSLTLNFKKVDLKLR